jgi:hypothetical protein
MKKIDHLMDSLLEKVESRSIFIKGPVIFFGCILYIIIHPIDFIKLVKKVNRDFNYDRNKSITKLKESDMPIYFPDFKNAESGYWDLEFSPGNGIEIIFQDNDVRVYVRRGSSESGYSTFLHSENPSWSDIERCVNSYQTNEFKKLKNRESRIDEIIGD